MEQPLDEQYLVWLYRQVASVRLKNPARTYWSLITQLHQKIFEWSVPNDDNRVEDGRDLRIQFIREHEIDVDPEWLARNCTMLEMLIGLSQRLSYESVGDSRRWFWELLENIELRRYTDAYYQGCDYQIVNRTLDRVIERSYSPDGRGGLFPLNDSSEDQRNVELWYQMSHYLLERD